MKFEGDVIKYGRDVDTDCIIAARYLNTSDPDELAKHCMQDLDPTFVERVKPGDIIVAEENSSTATPSTSGCPSWNAPRPSTASARATR